ncbi:stage II sporulation protein M [Planctomicrobium sp. SH661]|uniref:stage II sporulation protein M n=1 Tax=Planctomicrobium sp. SH661 TaxID=3448124 RepID=UPI003F5AFA8E
MSSFVGRYKKDWDELEALIHRARRKIRRLSAQDRERLDLLYRRVTVQLSRASTSTRDTRLITYLNDLTAKAHSLIYLPPRSSLFSGGLRFISEGFARAIARNWPAHLMSFALVIGGALLGYAAAMSDPLLAHALWPAEDSRQPGSTQEQLLEHLRGGRDDGGGMKFLFASFLFQHNFKVGLLAMATGILASIPTVFLMLFNGMLLGVFTAIHAQAGIHSEMWAWILPHGITELGAIILCGGIGLMLGQAVTRPGLNSRKQALVLAGKEAARIAAGVGLMLIAAAAFESYVRQSHLSTSSRLVFAAATAVFWTGYLIHGFKRERAAQQAEAEQFQARLMPAKETSLS